MDIFISWSGPRSGAVAAALKKWLPMIVNAFKPWLSSADIGKGARWGADVAGKLQAAKAGIICLTPSNVSAPWILFEAGALSKTLENTFVCPLLVDLEPSDVTGPLAQFQATRATKDEMLKLLKTLNGGLREAALPEAQIEEAFDVWWPKLEADLKKLPPEGRAQRPQRTDRELLEELVDAVRSKNASDDERLAVIERNLREVAGELLGVGGLLRWERNRLAHTSAVAPGRQWQDSVEAALGDPDAAVQRAVDAAVEARDATARRVAAVTKAAREAAAKNFMQKTREVDPKTE